MTISDGVLWMDASALRQDKLLDPLDRSHDRLLPLFLAHPHGRLHFRPACIHQNRRRQASVHFRFKNLAHRMVPGRMTEGSFEDLDCCGRGDGTMDIDETAVRRVGSKGGIDGDCHDDVGHGLFDFFVPRVLLGNEQVSERSGTLFDEVN
jgi:hypothetical protein